MNLEYITENILAVSLEQEIPPINGDFSSFFLVEHTKRKDLTENIIRYLISAGCRYFHFFGKQAHNWCTITKDVADKASKSGLVKDFILTSEYDTIDELYHELYYHTLEGTESFHSNYVFYDDRIGISIIENTLGDYEIDDRQLWDKVLFAEKTLASLGAKPEVLPFTMQRFTPEGKEILSLHNRKVIIGWKLNGIYYAVDTVITEAESYLLIMYGADLRRKFEDGPLFSPSLSDEEIAEEVRDVVLGEVYSDVDVLHTPCGDIVIEDSNGRRIPFSVKKNPIYEAYRFTENDYEFCIPTRTDYEIFAPSDRFRLHEKYKIFFTGGRLRSGPGDDHLTSLIGTYGDYAIGLGSYDPNSNEKLGQTCDYCKEMGYSEQHIVVHPPEYDESEFKEFTTDYLDDYTGFSFQLFDYSFDKVFFYAAWVENTLFDNKAVYEEAVDFWVTS